MKDGFTWCDESARAIGLFVIMWHFRATAKHPEQAAANFADVCGDISFFPVTVGKLNNIRSVSLIFFSVSILLF